MPDTSRSLEPVAGEKQEKKMSLPAKARLWIIFTISAIAIASVVGTVKASAQALNNREEALLGETTLMDRRQAARVVARIDVKPAGETGSGIVLGYHDGRLYIATAFHVAATAGRTGKIEVYFQGIHTPLEGKPVKGAADETLDLAVIYVSYPPQEVTAGLVPFRTARAEDAGELQGTVYTIGHPAGEAWALRKGPLLSIAGRDFLSISTALNEFGMSGGPLFTPDFKLIGILVKQGDKKDTALRIERALEKFAAWRVPYHLWFTHSFCVNLETIINQHDKKFAGLKLGAGRESASSSVEQGYWDSSLDLMGRSKSRIVMNNDGGLRYESLISDKAGIEEGERLTREVGRAIKQCIPDAYVSRDKWGLTFTFKKSFWGRPRTIRIWNGTFVKFQFPD
jgi:hypothetical protein